MSILSPAGWIYGRIAALRNSLYDRGVFKSHSLGARCISIGNITTGGTGKTPLVACVAEILTENGEKVCILTRGYGRKDPGSRVLVSDLENVLTDARTGGDEPVELATKLAGRAVVVADADRVSAGQWARETFGITAFVLDDGFQHRRAKRDLDIVCIGATSAFGNGEILPAGRLRELQTGLDRADVIVITRADQTENISALRSEVSKFSPKAHVFEASNKIEEMTELREFHSKSEMRQDERIRPRLDGKFLAFCGLGNPANFFKQLTSEGLDVVVKKAYPDHYFYRQEEVAKLERLARSGGAEALLTTAKDAVKLSEINFALPCFVVRTRLLIDNPEEFRRIVTSSS